MGEGADGGRAARRTAGTAPVPRGASPRAGRGGVRSLVADVPLEAADELRVVEDAVEPHEAISA